MDEVNPYQEDDASKLAGEIFSGKLAVGDALAKLRTRLLDLSMRNRLLNYRHPKGRSFQFTNDPDLNLLYERLEEGKPVQFAYVPDPPVSRYEGGKKPDVRLYAREQGIGTSVDVREPQAATAYKRLPPLQVLQYPADLERMVRKVSSEARTVVEETGTNMLYLMFGFLEYYDSDESEKAVYAPLLSMPVNLVRGQVDTESRTYIYELNYSGEDIAENFTLREKLRQQFRLELPELSEDDTPEAYFTKIQAAVSKRPKWTVKRRLSLGFLSFGKLAIWADLDPEKSSGLVSSELLRNIFEGGRVDASEAFHAEDYIIDSHEDGELPLIYDADSSQHSAIIDVKNGKSLVINGPPGTGKSQTITNIVASAIAGGKKVLFVSEKLAALEVVKQRLQAAGLGDFCLELHSHKTQKKQLLESIEQRMSRQFTHPAGYTKRIEVLRERRNALNAYAELLGSRIANKIDLTVHEIFWATERRRQALDEEVQAVSGLRILGAGTWSPEQIERCRMVLSDAASSLEQLGCAPEVSPWLGYVPGLLIGGDEVPILTVIEAALQHAESLTAAASELQSIFSTGDWTIEQIELAGEVTLGLDSVPGGLDGSLLGQMYAGGVKCIQGVANLTERLAATLGQVRQLRMRAKPSLSRLDIADGERFQGIASSASQVLNDATRALSLGDVDALTVRLSEALTILKQTVGALTVQLPRDTKWLQGMLDQACSHPERAAVVMLPAARIVEAASAAAASAHAVRGELNQIESVLRESQVPFNGHVDELAAFLDGHGMPELLPDAAVEGPALDQLHQLSSAGWNDWTVGQFSAKAREIGELLASSKQAADELTTFFSRLGIPIDTTQSGLDGIESLLTAVEDAPHELLAFRTPNLERQDFADVAIHAEESHKSVAYRGSKVAAAFHLDTLPDDDSLRGNIRIFRQGDSLFNFLKSDWRRAKAAFFGSARDKRKKLSATEMGEQFAAALSWRTSLNDYNTDAHFRSVLGSLFDGVKTDYVKVRRLHAWVRSSHQTLLGTDLGQHVNINTWPEQHVSLLRANASRVRGWVNKVQHLSRAIPALPGVDPALARARRIDELFTPLDEYTTELQAGAALLKKVVRPTATVARAVELVALRRRLIEHGDLLRSLIKAPARLCAAGASLGLSTSLLVYQDIRAALAKVEGTAQAARELGEQISANLSAAVSPHCGLEIIRSLDTVNVAAKTFLSGFGLPTSGPIEALIAACTRQSLAVQELAEFLRPYANPGVRLSELIDATQAALDSEALLAAVECDPEFLSTFGPHLRGLDTDESAARTCMKWAWIVDRIVTKLPDGAADKLLSADAITAAAAARTGLKSANTALAFYKEHMAALETWGRLDWDAWGGTPLPVDAVTRLRRAKEGAGRLVVWSKFLAAKEDASSLGLGEVLRTVEAGRVAPASAITAFEFVFYRTLTRNILTAHKELARFSGPGHERLRAEFAEMDRELIALNGAMYAARVDKAKKLISGVSAGRAGDLTEMALLTKEIKKQKRHVPIRQLLKRAGRSLQQLKPCFMMGPLSVAQYLEQGQLHFDLVVMDEASQLRPEDALGAIARGKQLVVVGDPKQLPPTNFFDRLMDGDDEDLDDTPAVVDGVESILGICEHLYRPVRTLRWHYRSRHESLIAFSNSQFYDGRLVVFPSPYKRNKRLGVNYKYVSEGLYQDRRNIPEARRVVDAVIQHMLTCPEESLGVVTLNQTQRELIEDLLDQKVRNVSGVAEYLDRHEKEGWKFFVKNLENVQGDERDVIFVSTTFGKPPGSTAVRQNFGPINRPDGWRRLNVLFTRARRRLDLFSSMLPTDVQVDEKASLGRRALRDYLEFAKSGLLPNVRESASGREADSDFELSVAQALLARGFETEPQLGVAGYFIDLGVRNPERRSDFLAAIECDGATYHSSLSARDRDRIRQEVLESLGWRGRIIRVWSTDWFADPHGQTDRLVSFLEERRALDLAQPAPYSDEDVGPDDALADFAEPDSVANVLDSVSPDAVCEQQETKLFVEVGDRITFLALSDKPETHTVQIVDSASNPKHGLLNEGTAVAQALLGLCEGDEALLKVQGQPSHSLRILKIARDTVDLGRDVLGPGVRGAP